jgi:hypothetical protein
MVLTACVSVSWIAVTGSFGFADSVETWNLSPHRLLFESRTLSAPNYLPEIAVPSQSLQPNALEG